MNHLPYKQPLKSIWTWSAFHLNNMPSHIKTKKKCNKTDNNEKLEKSPARGTVSMNKCTKICADWNIFRYKNCSIFLSQTQGLEDSRIHRLTNIFFSLVISYSRKSEKPTKKFRPLGGKALWKLDTIIHSYDV